MGSECGYYDYNIKEDRDVDNRSHLVNNRQGSSGGLYFGPFG